MLSFAQALWWNREEARRSAPEAVKLVPEAVDSWADLPNRASLAFGPAWPGDKERAGAESARRLRRPSFGGAVSTSGTDADLNVPIMRRHPYFSARGDPRFEARLNDPKNNAPLF